MTKYRGYYIDKESACGFKGREEIDDFIRNRTIDSYQKACRRFAENSTMESSIYCDEIAEYLVNSCGLTWAEVEELEIEAYQQIA